MVRLLILALTMKQTLSSIFIVTGLLAGAACTSSTSSTSNPPNSGGGGHSSTDSGCGGGCLGVGECGSAADCGDSEYCQKDEDCLGLGRCAPLPTTCAAPVDPSEAVCGCNGELYATACEANQAGQSAHVSVTECSTPPAGMFACGDGYCDVSTEYCAQVDGGDIGCRALPAACTVPSCDCFDYNVCGTCIPRSDGGLLGLHCQAE